MDEYAKVADVFSSLNYDMFRHLEGNREVTNGRKQKIEKSIIDVGYVMNPIVVNEHMEIIDGGGRFEALRELSLPILFVIAEGAGLNQCIAMNVGMSNWGLKDYINSYAKKGNENYINFRDVQAAYPMFTAAEIWGIVSNLIVAGGSAARPIKNGELIFPNGMVGRVCETLDYLMEIDTALLQIPGSNRVKRTALSWVINNTDINKSRLKKILLSKFALIRPVADTKPTLFLEDLSEIYNSKLSAKNCVYLETEYKKAIKSKGERK